MSNPTPTSVQHNDTIAAIATAPGHAGVGIVRVSGNKVQQIATAMLGSVPAARVAQYGAIKDTTSQVLDVGISLFFQQPHSFTGEDVLELQVHGGPVVLDQILQATLQLGARVARPGEFSERAYLNDKLDLAQAEAIADLIEAGTVQAARCALNSLQGVFSERIDMLVEALTQLRMYVEAAIDFPEEEVDFLSDGKILADIDAIVGEYADIMRLTRQGIVMREGMNVVMLGQPNTGKSSLLNALAGRDSAIVTDIAGTTRDVLREQIHLDGMPLHLVDTAGLRESANVVEQEGIRRAWQEVSQSDHVLVLIDNQQGITKTDLKILADMPENMPVTFVHNKIDLLKPTSDENTQPRKQTQGENTHIYLSVKTGAGLDLLTLHLKQSMGYTQSGEGVFSARRRHLDALERAEKYITSARQQLVEQQAGELMAEDLRQAQNILGEITGKVSSDALLGRIFSSFCIGK